MARLTPNPILKVLSELNRSRVRYLLMGGQACVLYGGAEFSRDTDIVILADTGNMDRLSAALDQLQASPIALPPFELDYLLRGHAVHFRCRHPEAPGQRIDVMSVMRAWRRSQTFGSGARPWNTKTERLSNCFRCRIWSPRRRLNATRIGRCCGVWSMRITLPVTRKPSRIK